MENGNTIIMDLKNIDTVSNKELKDFIQRDALKSICRLLENDVNRKIKTSDDIYKVRLHNAIFINGVRGSGKTELLVGIKKFLKKDSKDSLKLSSKIHFFHPVDPTLLHENEHFLTIILARILNDINNKDGWSPQLNESQTNFYKSLNNIARAIDGVIKNTNHSRTSLENMSQDQTSLKLEEYMHSFFREVTVILGKSRLVLLIDDVDMAFERGFDVLEVVRKYLSSPYVIPIITGDLKLYKTIATNHFITKIDESIKETYLEEHPTLIYDYLSKVLPMHKRVKVKSIYELSRKSNIVFIYGGKRYILRCPECEQGKNREENDIYFRNIAKEIFDSEELGDSLIENLFSNPLRNIIQFLNRQFVAGDKLLSLTTEKLKRLEDEFGLMLLKNIQTEKAYIDTAIHYYNYRDYEKSIKLAQTANNIKETADAYYVMAKSYFKNLNSDYISAKENYLKTIELDPDYFKAYCKLGYMYKNGYPQDENSSLYTAMEYFKKSIEIKPTYDAYNGLGTTYLHTKEYTLASDNFLLAKKMKPNRAKAYLNIIESSFLDDKTDKKMCTSGFEKIFKDRFIGDTKAMLIYDMIKILKSIQKADTRQNVKDAYQEWEKCYPEKVYLGEWSFLLTRQHIEDDKNIMRREQLSKYFSLFLKKIK